MDPCLMVLPWTCRFLPTGVDADDACDGPRHWPRCFQHGSAPTPIAVPSSDARVPHQRRAGLRPPSPRFAPMTAISAASATESDGHEMANPFPDLPAIHGSDASAQPPHFRRPAPWTYLLPRFGDY